MARYVVPVVVLLALVGGYVVGQQPATEKPPAAEKVEPLKSEPGETVEEGVSLGFDSEGFKTLPSKQVLHYELISDLPNRGVSAPAVGRYVPFEGGRMLDTTNGTLYAVSGERWTPIVTVDAVPNPEHQAPKQSLGETLGREKESLARFQKWQKDFKEYQGTEGPFGKYIETQKRRIERLEQQLAE